MYYITNQDQQIVAADSDFLSLLGVDDAQELLVQTASKQIILCETGKHIIEIKTHNRSVSLRHERHKLHTFIGDLFLHVLSRIQTEKDTAAPDARAQTPHKQSKSRISKIVAKPKETIKPKEKSKGETKTSEPEKKKEKVVRITAKPVKPLPKEEKSETKTDGRVTIPHTEKQKENLVYFVEKRKQEQAQTSEKAESPKAEKKEEKAIRPAINPPSKQELKLEEAAKRLMKTFKPKEKEPEKPLGKAEPKPEAEEEKLNQPVKFPDLKREKEDLVKFVAASKEEEKREQELIMFPEIEKETGDLVKFVSESREKKQEEEGDRILFPEPKEEKEEKDDLVIFPKVEKAADEKAATLTAESKPEEKEKEKKEDSVVFSAPKKIEEKKAAKAEIKPEPTPDENNPIIFSKPKEEENEVIELEVEPDDTAITFPELGEMADEKAVTLTAEPKPEAEEKEKEKKGDIVIFPELKETKEAKDITIAPASKPKEKEEKEEKKAKEAERAEETKAILEPASKPEPAAPPKADEDAEILLKVPEAEKQEEEPNFLKPDETILMPAEENVTVDTEALSKILGISQEDYREFLDEFIDKARENETIIKDKTDPKHQKSVTSLIKLAQMLHLTQLSDLLRDSLDGSGKDSEKEVAKKSIESFYHSLADLTTTEAIPEPKTVEPERESSDNQICDLNLDTVKPIHFDFQIEQAASDLGLPSSLIREFVGDFITQAREEKATFIQACKNGDIDTIHKTGHKLKGAASNLRINPLAETLEEIQFCEDRSRLEPLFKKYWGQFLAFELFMQKAPHQQGRK